MKTTLRLTVAAFVGLATWGFLLATGQVVELHTEPFKTGFLLGAEFLTAFSLVVGGFGLWMSKKWALRAGLAALGMLLYCTIFSTGVFGQAGNTPAIENQQCPDPGDAPRGTRQILGASGRRQVDHLRSRVAGYGETAQCRPKSHQEHTADDDILPG